MTHIISPEPRWHADRPVVITNQRQPRPNWLKAVYAFLAAVVAIIALSLCFAATQHPASSAVPNCQLEDGYTESKACVWHDGTGDTVINMNQGQLSYNVTTGKLTDWSK